MKPELRWGDGTPGRPRHYLFMGECPVGYVHRTTDYPWKSRSLIFGVSQDAPENTQESAMADLLKRTKAMLREAGE